jgi:DNA-binding NarL/FixJ family response regulator
MASFGSTINHKWFLKTMGRSAENNQGASGHSRIDSLDEKVWIISGNTGLVERIETLLHPLAEQIVQIAPETTDQQEFWINKSSEPTLIVLDIDRDVDQGFRIIQRLKRARKDTPVVVLTEDFSRDFGRKIISEGVRYYFSYDFCKDEFLKVAEILLEH